MLRPPDERDQVLNEINGSEEYVFKGHLNSFSLKNELAMWELIDQTASDQLDLYQNTLEEDHEILELDSRKHMLSVN